MTDAISKDQKEEQKTSYDELLKRAKSLEAELKTTKDELQIAKTANEEVTKVNTCKSI